MRGGLYTIQQALTTEAASVVKQALNLARRRNHAQVTPLHVAIALLESSLSLLRKACLKSHSHPLQCKALELCFNVSLNRLPTSTSSPFLGYHSSTSSTSSLSLSNALVAAFKRAQAHQRRGSIESQQQPILALKIEIEQLVVSILDDPSVSRVMREAGFSSTQVKSNVENAVSFEFFPQSPPLSSSTSLPKKSYISPLFDHLGPKPINLAREKDVMSVLNALIKDRKTNNVIIVGECLASAENIVRGVMDKLKRGDVDEKLECIQLINIPLLSLKNASKQEVETKLLDLKYIIRTYITKGLILYLGDLKWASEFWSSNCWDQKRSYYCPVQHMIMEIRRLVCACFEGDSKLWLMGIANFQTYVKCKAGDPSLVSIWNLRALSIPVESLGLSLKTDCDWNVACVESVDLSTRSASPINTTISLNSNLPPWLQHYKEEKRIQTTNDDLRENVHSNHSCNRWDSFFPKKASTSSYSCPASPSISSPFVLQSNLAPKEHKSRINEQEDQGFDTNPIMSELEKNELKPDLLSCPNSSPNSVTSSDAGEGTEEDLPMFKEFNTQNVATLCNGLEKKVPWQKEIILEIVNTVLQCRSGLMGKKREKEETWLFFLGVDSKGKLKISQDLARLIFSSSNNFTSINNSSSTYFASTRVDLTDEMSNKRKRDEMGGNYITRFAEAVHENPHRVFFLEEFEQLDFYAQMCIKSAIENGKLALENGDMVHFEDAVVIFSCESLCSISRACSPQPIKKKVMNSVDEAEDEEIFDLDLNTTIREDEHSVFEVGINDLVDKQIMFKLHECQSN